MGETAFRNGAARMPDAGDEDYDGMMDAGRSLRAGKWNRFKWILVLTNTILTAYSLAGLVACLMTVLNAWPLADVVRVSNSLELGFSLAASLLALFTSLIGWMGLLLNNRAFLAVYTLFCWVTFAVLVVPGYLTYRRLTFNLEGKINAQWSHELGWEGRLRVQDQLSCCGYFSPFVEASVSQACYARSILPGCKHAYLEFQRLALTRWYTIVFLVVPAQILIMVAALLCSNHVTYRFGKGMMPKQYRLDHTSMAYIMGQHAGQLAAQYEPPTEGTEVILKSGFSASPSKPGSLLSYMSY